MEHVDLREVADSEQCALTSEWLDAIKSKVDAKKLIVLAM